MNKKYINLIFIFWFLKIIFDMFYQIKVLSTTIFGLAVILFIKSIRHKTIKLKLIDLYALILIILFTISFCKSPSFYLDYIKIMSFFVLYFLGRLMFESEDKAESAIFSSLLIVFIINSIICLSGHGGITWGNATTLNGLYYFKTDFACMLTNFLTFWLLFYNKNKLLKILIVVITGLLIILANARIYYLIAAIILVLYLFYIREKRVFEFKTIIIMVFSMILIVLSMHLLSNLDFFKERNLINVNVESYEDLLNASNTQGRNVVWNSLLSNFNKQDLVTRVFGAKLAFYKEYGYHGLNEHSTYIKVLVNTGYFGLIIFILFLLSILKTIIKEKNLKKQYLVFILFITFIISGISAPTILFINTSWLPMYFAGLCVSNVQQAQKDTQK